MAERSLFERITKSVLSSLFATKGQPTLQEFKETFEEDFSEYDMTAVTAELGYASFDQLLEHIPGVTLKKTSRGPVVAINNDQNTGAEHIKNLVQRTQNDTRDEKKPTRSVIKKKSPKISTTPRSQQPSSSKFSSSTTTTEDDLRSSSSGTSYVTAASKQSSQSSLDGFNKALFMEIVDGMMQRVEPGQALPFEEVVTLVLFDYKINLNDINTLKQILGVTIQNRVAAINSACKGTFKAVSNCGDVYILRDDDRLKEIGSQRSSRSDLSSQRAEQNVPNKLYKTVLCIHYRSNGKCYKGNACTYAHGEHELRSPDPLRFKQEPTIVFYDPPSFSGTETEEPRISSNTSRNDDYEDYDPTDVESYVDFLVPLMRKHALVLMIDDIPDMLAHHFDLDPSILLFRRELGTFIQDLIDCSDGALTMFYRNGLPFLTLAERFNGDVNVTVPVNHSQDYTELLDAVDDALLNCRIDYDMTICQDNLKVAEKLLQFSRAPEEETCNIM